MKENRKFSICFIVTIFLFIFVIMPNKALATQENQCELSGKIEVNLINRENNLITNELKSEIQTYNATSTTTSSYENIRNELLKGSTYINVSSYGIKVKEVENYMDTLIELYPESYVFSLWYYAEDNGILTLIAPEYFIDIEDINYYYKKAEFMADNFISSIPENATEIEKVLYIHNYICENTEYDYEIYSGEETPIDHSMYGFFMNSITVCDGYSNAFMYLCRKAGIDCYLVTSKNLNHAWNEVKIGNNYYHVDTTWDDVVVSYEEIYGRWNYNYFLMSDTKMLASNHYSDDLKYNYYCTASTYDNSFIHELNSPIMEYEDNWYYIEITNNKVAINVIDNIDSSLSKSTVQASNIIDCGSNQFGNLNDAYPTIILDGAGILYTNGNKIYRITYSSNNSNEIIKEEIYKDSNKIVGLRIYNGRFQIQTARNYASKEITLTNKALAIDTEDSNDRDFNKEILNVNSTYKLKIASKNSDDECIWSSSDTNVATIDNNGVLKTVGVGIANITLTQGKQVRTMLIYVRDYVNITLKYKSSRATVYLNGVEIEAGNYSYPKGSTLNVNIICDENYFNFKGWIIDGEKIDYRTFEINNISKDLELVAKVDRCYSIDEIEDLIFDYKYYADNNADLKKAFGYNETELRNHYIKYGIKEGRVASNLFDVKYYLNNNADLKKTFGDDYTSAYNHFVIYGFREGRPSSKIYYGLYYGSAYKDLILFDSYDLMSHFKNYGLKEGRKATNVIDLTPIDITGYLFNSTFYADLYEDVRKFFGYNETELRNHYINYGIKEGRIASIFFDPKYYLNKYSDLKDAFGNNYTLAYNHFIKNGINEGRTASIYFDVNYYLNNYSDLKSAFGSNYSMALRHFYTNGIKEGRDASSLFKILVYKSSYNDLRIAYGDNNMKYFIHYEKYGKKEGRKAY